VSMDDYECAVALIDKHGEAADFAGPRPPGLIDRAERAVDVLFPPTYRRFLVEYGAGSIGGTEIYGVIDADFENSSIPDAVWHNLTMRRDGYGEGLFSFHAVGDGEEYCLDTSRLRPDGEMPVVGVYVGSDERREIAADFGRAFLMLLREELGLNGDE
jgi:SMI1-KNR4 cell-wall